MKKNLILILLLLFTLISSAPTLGERLVAKRNNLILAELEKEIIENRIKEIKQLNFNQKLLVEYINLIDPTLSDVPIRQFILETGWFKSTLFLEHNNIAGMKLPKTRKTTAIGEALGHAVYEHWTDSIDDYIHWKEYWENRGYNSKNYYDFLSNIGYATSKNYEKTLKSINLNC